MKSGRAVKIFTTAWRHGGDDRNGSFKNEASHRGKQEGKDSGGEIELPFRGRRRLRHMSSVVLSSGTIHRRAGPYYWPNVRIRAKAVERIRIIMGRFADYVARNRACFAMERHMDRVAEPWGKLLRSKFAGEIF